MPVYTVFMYINDYRKDDSYELCKKGYQRRHMCGSV